MKKLSLLFFIITGIFLTSCKKDVSPELEITVNDINGNKQKNAKVKVSVDGATDGIVNSRVIDSVNTDQFGKAFFQFDNTILIDVAVFSQDGTVSDSLSILCETKKLKSKENNVYTRTMTYK